MKINYVYLLVVGALMSLSTQCNPDAVSDTFLVLQNDTGEKAEVTFHAWKAGDDMTFTLEAGEKKTVDTYQAMGKSDFQDFTWVSAHFDSLTVKTPTKESSKKFIEESEWTFVKSNSDGTYTLVIDQADF